MKKRIISFIMVICMTVSVLPFKNYIDLFKNGITVEAYEHIDEYPDFSLEMYIADLMTNPTKDDPSYKRLSFYVEEAESPNTVIFKLLRDDASFRNSVSAWETMNAIFDPSAETVEFLDEEGYYEAIILNALNSSFKSQDYNAAHAEKAYKTVDSLYSYFENNSKLVYYIQNFDKLTSQEVTDFGKAFTDAYKKEVSDIADFSDFMENVNTIYKLCKTANEFIEKTVSYYYCNKMTDEMKNLVHLLYNNCDGKANPGLKLALSNIVTACDNYTLSIVDAFSDTAFTVGVQTWAKVTDKFMKSCIAYFPAGKAILLTQAITKSAVNFILSTDKICEQYYKMERLYNFEMLIRSTLKSQMKGYQASPSESNAKLLFAALDVFFKTYDIGGEYANDYANLMFKENIVGRIFNDTATYNQLTLDIRKLRSYAQEAKEYLKNTHYLYILEGEYPEIYEAYMIQLGTASAPKEIKVLGVEFDKQEIELGLDDSFAVLNAVLQPTNATNRQIIYTSSDTNVAECSYGAVYPHSLGTAVITATTVDGGYTDELIVNIVEGHGIDGTPHLNPSQLVPVKVGDTFESGGLRYKVTSEDTVSITGGNVEGLVYIPNAIAYLGKIFTVTSIEDYAFNQLVDYEYHSSYDKLTGIVLPDSITSIGKCAFRYRKKLTYIKLSNSLISIGEDAFDSCSNLENLQLPNSLITIGFGAFDSSGITSIDIPDSVTNIEACAFIRCGNLKSVTLPQNINVIKRGTFWKCSSLESIVIPNGVTSIESYWYNYDYWGAFSGCKNLKNVIIPNTVTSIGEAAFEDCENLTSITIPDSVVSIGECAFSGCTNLIDIKLSANLTVLNGGMFYNCKNMEFIVLPNKIETIKGIGWRIYYDNPTFGNCEKLKEIIIPSAVTEIEKRTFENCTGLVNITFNNSITRIQNYAFDNCGAISNVYYLGSQNEWNNISIGSNGNDCLISATIHYNYIPPKGDVNLDGSFNVADVVLLQKWLLAVPDVKLANWKAADLCEDGRLDVFDLCLMKRLLLNS